MGCLRCVESPRAGTCINRVRAGRAAAGRAAGCAAPTGCCGAPAVDLTTAHVCRCVQQAFALERGVQRLRHLIAERRGASYSASSATGCGARFCAAYGHIRAHLRVGRIAQPAEQPAIPAFAAGWNRLRLRCAVVCTERIFSRRFFQIYISLRAIQHSSAAGGRTFIFSFHVFEFFCTA